MAVGFILRHTRHCSKGWVSSVESSENLNFEQCSRGYCILLAVISDEPFDDILLVIYWKLNS